jgi:hypothetical protein
MSCVARRAILLSGILTPEIVVSCHDFLLHQEVPER